MITIINYGVGNLNSIRNILKRIGVESVISNSKEEIAAANKLILPGVGHFDYCMKTFNTSGLRDVVEKKIISEKVPVLGICVGCQMLVQSSQEGKEKGLGFIDGEVVLFDQEKLHTGAKIPHMGWTTVSPRGDQALYNGIEEPRFYFVHSYHLNVANNTDISGVANYGYDFVASVAKENIQGVQFHPEKSHKYGMQLLGNFSNS